MRTGAAYTPPTTMSILMSGWKGPSFTSADYAEFTSADYADVFRKESVTRSGLK
jgi:hypothetical protein